MSVALIMFVCASVVCCVATQFTWTEHEALPAKESSHGLVDPPCQDDQSLATLYIDVTWDTVRL